MSDQKLQPYILIINAKLEMGPDPTIPENTFEPQLKSG